MADVRKVSVPWTCDTCVTRSYGLQLVDDANLRTWTMLPTGWWYYPVDYGDTDGEGERAVMVHAYCSEACVRKSLEKAAEQGAVDAQKAPAGPLRAPLGDVVRRRKVPGP
jgi:hypothetical protein